MFQHLLFRQPAAKVSCVCNVVCVLNSSDGLVFISQYCPCIASSCPAPHTLWLYVGAAAPTALFQSIKQTKKKPLKGRQGSRQMVQALLGFFLLLFFLKLLEGVTKKTKKNSVCNLCVSMCVFWGGKAAEGRKDGSGGSLSQTDWQVWPWQRSLGVQGHL